MGPKQQKYSTSLSGPLKMGLRYEGIQSILQEMKAIDGNLFLIIIICNN